MKYMINIIEELVYGDCRRAVEGQYHKPFYSHQIIKGKVNLLANRKVVMATIEGLLVLSSLRLGVNASEDQIQQPFYRMKAETLFYHL